METYQLHTFNFISGYVPLLVLGGGKLGCAYRFYLPIQINIFIIHESCIGVSSLK